MIGHIAAIQGTNRAAVQAAARRCCALRRADLWKWDQGWYVTNVGVRSFFTVNIIGRIYGGVGGFRGVLRRTAGGDWIHSRLDGDLAPRVVQLAHGEQRPVLSGVGVDRPAPGTLIEEVK